MATVDKIQYIRLLAEINASSWSAGYIRDLCDSMDVTPEFIEEIFASAERDFESVKQTLVYNVAPHVPVGTPISQEEAIKIASEQNGIITGGGYTFLPNNYCGAGTVPSCFRGGDTTTINTKIDQWYRLTLRDLIIKNGFYPCPFSLATLVEYQANAKDYSINIQELIDFCINGPYTADQLKNNANYGNSSIWSKYFEREILNG